MTPDEINSQALRGTIGLIIIVFLVLLTANVTSSEAAPTLVAASAIEAAAPASVVEPVGRATPVADVRRRTAQPFQPTLLRRLRPRGRTRR